MSHSPVVGPTQQWVGTILLEETPEFIRWTFRADGSATLDRPRRFQFGIPLHQDPPGDGTVDRFTAGSLVFTGTFSEAGFSGNAAEGLVGGACELRTVAATPIAGYRRLIGAYRFPSGRTVVLSQDARPAEPLYFYTDQDRLVRLHPLDDNRFLSEQGETITAPDEHGPASYLTWQNFGAAPVQATRADWWREEEVRVPGGDHELAGTLLLPPGAGPHPAVLLCHLASTHQRDYYRIYALPFVRRGIAAFIYDKRGSGESTGDPLSSAIFPLADDATAVFRFLQQHPAIRSDALGLWGISNGAWVITLTAERTGAAAFLIAASGAGVSPARQEQLRRANVARALGASPRGVALIDRLWALLFQFAVDGRWTADLEAILTAVNADAELQSLPKHPDHGPGLQPVPPVVPIEQIRAEEGSSWPEGGFDPAPICTGLRCPMLWVWGADDDVLPVAESRQRLEAALRASRHPDYQLTLIPQATHLLYATPPSPTGILPEVMHTHLHNVLLAPGVRDLMANWAAQRVLQQGDGHVD